MIPGTESAFWPFAQNPYRVVIVMRHIVLTIGRTFGSGGRLIGKKVAEKCGMTYYDKELLELAAKESGMSLDVLENIDESAGNSLLYTLSTGGAHLLGTHFAQTAEPPLHDKLYIAQANIIKDIAARESCVIVGRCADYLLRNMEECVKVFIYAPSEARIKRAVEVYGIPENKAADQIRKTDKKRSGYYNFYSGKKWGNLDNYHLSVDSSLLGIDATADMIAEFVRQRAESLEK